MPATGLPLFVVRVGIERVVCRRVEEGGHIVAAVGRIADVRGETLGRVGIRRRAQHARQLLAAVVVIRVGIESVVAGRVEEYGRDRCRRWSNSRDWCRSRWPSWNSRRHTCPPTAGRCVVIGVGIEGVAARRIEELGRVARMAVGMDRGHAIDGDRIARGGIVELPAAVGVKQRAVAARRCRSRSPCRCRRRRGRHNW